MTPEHQTLAFILAGICKYSRTETKFRQRGMYSKTTCIMKSYPGMAFADLFVFRI